MEQIKVKELYELCRQQMLIGNADKMICISDDNEGNGFHGLFMGFTPLKGKDYDLSDLISDSKSYKDEEIIILG